MHLYCALEPRIAQRPISVFDTGWLNERGRSRSYREGTTRQTPAACRTVRRINARWMAATRVELNAANALFAVSRLWLNYTINSST